MTLLSPQNDMAFGTVSRPGASQVAPGTSAPRVHHTRISRRRHFLLKSRNLKERRKFKDVKREVKPETIKLKHAVMPRGKVRHLSPSVAPCTDNKCECCLEGCGDGKCKRCHQPLCSNCCFASEEAPTMWYCPACVFPEWCCQSTFSEGKKAKTGGQKKKGTIKKGGKLKKSEVPKTADDEYDKWVQKTIQFLRERPPEQHHWEELCRFLSTS